MCGRLPEMTENVPDGYAVVSGSSDYVQTRQRPRNVRFDYGPASDAELTLYIIYTLPFYVKRFEL